jgi:hypothetical protein
VLAFPDNILILFNSNGKRAAEISLKISRGAGEELGLAGHATPSLSIGF